VHVTSFCNQLKYLIPLKVLILKQLSHFHEPPNGHHYSLYNSLLTTSLLNTPIMSFSVLVLHPCMFSVGTFRHKCMETKKKNRQIQSVNPFLWYHKFIIQTNITEFIHIYWQQSLLMKSENTVFSKCLWRQRAGTRLREFECTRRAKANTRSQTDYWGDHGQAPRRNFYVWVSWKGLKYVIKGPRAIKFISCYGHKSSSQKSIVILRDETRWLQISPFHLC